MSLDPYVDYVLFQKFEKITVGDCASDSCGADADGRGEAIAFSDLSVA